MYYDNYINADYDIYYDNYDNIESWETLHARMPDRSQRIYH